MVFSLALPLILPIKYLGDQIKVRNVLDWKPLVGQSSRIRVVTYSKYATYNLNHYNNHYLCLPSICKHFHIKCS